MYFRYQYFSQNINLGKHPPDSVSPLLASPSILIPLASLTR